MPPFVIAHDAPSGAFLPEPWPLRVKTRGGFFMAPVSMANPAASAVILTKVRIHSAQRSWSWRRAEAISPRCGQRCANGSRPPPG
jgi:hypothetical protein